jgi:hypothetical protein
MPLEGGWAELPAMRAEPEAPTMELEAAKTEPGTAIAEHWAAPTRLRAERGRLLAGAGGDGWCRWLTLCKGIKTFACLCALCKSVGQVNVLYPEFNLKFLPRMLGLAVLGGLAGGCYGILHDQITYSISPEYFTKLKFAQFSYANFGFPLRVYVAEIGFLATWWVGFFAAWFLARIAVPAWPGSLAFRRTLGGFSIIFLTALASAVIGYFLGVFHGPDYSHWEELCEYLGVTDAPDFVRVAYIHNASYLGGFVGLIAAIIYLLRLKRRIPPSNRQGGR